MTVLPLRLRHLRRYRQILQAVGAHGFGYLLGRGAGAPWLVRWVRPRSGEDLPRAVRLRHLLEELGPTFVKLGQLLSLRTDLLPEDIVRELEHLQDHVPPEPAEAVRKVIVESLGRTPEEAFASFDWQPIAAASLGQVHAATLEDGRPVVVKVQRPGVRRTVADDLAVLEDLAAVFDRSRAIRAVSDPHGLIEEFRRNLEAEMDYTREAKHADRLRQALRGLPVAVPHVHWDRTAPRVLTLEALYGTKPTDRAAMAAAGHDPRRIARLLARAELHMIFRAGYFHADPHPGNLSVLPDGRLVLYDLGMVGHLLPKVKDAFADLSAALFARDTQGVVAGILSLGEVPATVDVASLTRDVENLRDRYYDIPLPQVNLGTAIADILKVSYRHQVRIPNDLSLLAKALLTLEGVMERLDPELSMMEVARPYGRALLSRRLPPERWWRLGRSLLREAEAAAHHLPHDVSQLVGMTARQGLAVHFTAESERARWRSVRRNRQVLALGLVWLGTAVLTGSFIVAQAIRPSLNAWHAMGPLFYILPVLAAVLIWVARHHD